MEGSQRRSQQEPGSRSWCKGHEGVLLTSLLLRACSVYLFIEPRTISVGVAPPTLDCTLPHQWLIKKCPKGLHTTWSYEGISIISGDCLVSSSHKTSQHTQANIPGSIGENWFSFCQQYQYIFLVKGGPLSLLSTEILCGLNLCSSACAFSLCEFTFISPVVSIWKMLIL